METPLRYRWLVILPHVKLIAVRHSDWLYKPFPHVKIKRIDLYKWALWNKILMLCVIKWVMNIDVLWDWASGLLSLPDHEETRDSNHLQMSLQRQHFLLSYFKTLSDGLARVFDPVTSHKVVWSELTKPAGWLLNMVLTFDTLHFYFFFFLSIRAYSTCQLWDKHSPIMAILGGVKTLLAVILLLFAWLVHVCFAF